MYRRTKNDFERRAAASVKAKISGKTKQNKKTNVTPEKDDTISANQTPGGYKFAPLVASQLWRANQREPDSFGLFSPWSFPSRSGILVYCISTAIYFAMKRSAPCSAVLRHFPSSWAAVVPWSMLMPKALRLSRKHPNQLFFPGPPRSPRTPPSLRTSRTLTVSYPPCAPQIPRTRSASCVKSPRRSHLPSS